MDLGPGVVDISSDDEADGFTSRKCLDVPYDSIKEGGNVINFVDLDQYLNSKVNSGPLRPKSGAVRDDSDDECMILDGDPDKPVATGGDKKVTTGSDKRDVGDESDDLCIVGQKGQVACRDYPHSRHLCANFPFSTTSHVKHCNLCHCFVCDSPAPCIYWGNGVTFSDHCHATDKDEIWKARRKSFKKINTTTLPSQKFPVSQRPFPPIRNPQQIFYRNPPCPTPIQPTKATTIHPCSTTSTATAYATPQRLHPIPASYYCRQRPPQQQTPSEPPQSGKRANRGGLALTPTSHTQFKRVAADGSDLMSSGMTHPLHNASSPNQTHRTVSKRPQHPPVTSCASQQQPVVLPRSRSMPVSWQRSVSTPLTTQKSQKTAVTSSEVDTRREWQRILAGVAAELGVSDSINQSLTSAQPYTVTSSPTAFDVPIQCQMTPNQVMATPTDLGSQTISSKSMDFDPKWCHYLPEQNQGGDSQQAAVQSFNPLVSGNSYVVSGDILAAVEESAPMPGKEVGPPEVDSTSFLYDLHCGWSSIANV